MTDTDLHHDYNDIDTFLNEWSTKSGNLERTENCYSNLTNVQNFDNDLGELENIFIQNLPRQKEGFLFRYQEIIQ